MRRLRRPVPNTKPPKRLHRLNGAANGRNGLSLGDLDATDLRIINLLQENGRASHIEMARAIGVTEGTVRRRVERLISSSIIKIAAVLNPAKTGYLTNAIIGISTERGRLLDIGTALARRPEVVYVSYTTGLYDIIIEVLFRSEDQLFNFLTESLSEVPGIRRVWTFHVLRTAKINYDWKLPVGFLLDAQHRA
jgi:Lrp/AsnC family transcriptional regulator for asnA, asnC and gidA